MELIRGTTPTIQFTYKDINVNQITVAYLIIKQNNLTVIEKQLSEALVNSQNKVISWTLSQEESLSLTANTLAKIECDWKTDQGLRGRSEVLKVSVVSSAKNEVI